MMGHNPYRLEAGMGTFKHTYWRALLATGLDDDNVPMIRCRTAVSSQAAIGMDTGTNAIGRMRMAETKRLYWSRTLGVKCDARGREPEEVGSGGSVDAQRAGDYPATGPRQ